MYKGWNTPKVFLLNYINSLLIKKKSMPCFPFKFLSWSLKLISVCFGYILQIKHEMLCCWGDFVTCLKYKYYIKVYSLLRYFRKFQILFLILILYILLYLVFITSITVPHSKGFFFIRIGVLYFRKYPTHLCIYIQCM